MEAANTEEEAESSTTYLEQLMEKLVGNGENAPVESKIENKAVESIEKESSFVETRDHEVSELHLKLEIEKLKYKILEQEMRFGARSEPTYSENRRAIDYHRLDDSVQQESYSTRRRPKRAELEEEEFQTITDDSLDDVSGKSDTPVQRNPFEDDHGVSDIVDSEQVESGNERSDEETDLNKVLVDESSGMAQVEGEAEEVTQTLVEVVSPDENDEQNANLTIIEEVSPVVDPIVLPSLYNPPHKPPADIP